MKIKEITRRLIVDILYAALEDGDVGFLKNAYDELKLHDNKRIRKMRKNWNKISSKAVNTVYEDIIGIIVEEICQKANRGLLDDLMGYYLKRFPDVQERIDDFGDDMEGLLDHQTSIYPFVQERDEDEGEYRISAINDNFSESGSDYADFLKRSLILLYAITTCKDNSTGAHTYIRKIQEQMFANYKDEKFLFYDRQQKIANRIQWVKIIEGDSCYFTRFKTLFIQDMRRLFSQVYDIAPEKMEEYILDEIIGMGGELHEYKNTLYKLNPIGIREMMDSICKKLHVNTLEILDSANREKYIRTIKEIFEKWCRNEMANIGYDYNYDLGTGINEPVGIDELDLERCVSEVAAAFLFQCYVESQQGIWDEYYQNFSFDSKAEVMEELYEKCSRLNDENIQYRKKIQSYEEADSLRKKQQNKKAKELDKQYTEKVALLEKQIGEQALLQENMREYIRLVEAAGDKAIKAEEADYVKIFNHKIVFVGGAPETKSRLKAVFRTAAFIKDENMPVPAKADLIVLLAGNTDHTEYLWQCAYMENWSICQSNIAWMKKLHPDMQDVFSRTIDGAKDLSEEERMEAIREIFDVLMGYIIYSDISVRYYGMAKGILFVMKELGAESYLDQKMVMANEHLIEKFICIVNPKERKKVEELLDTCGFREKVIT